jgi:hypothetical protein
MIKINPNIPGCALETAVKTIGWLSSQVPENGMIVEIGVFWGRVTNAIIENKSSGTKIVCIDPCFSLENIIRILKRNVLWGDTNLIIDYLKKNNYEISLSSIVEQNSSIEDVIFEQKKSDDVKIDYSVNMAIVDGNHEGTYPAKDIMKFLTQPECLIVVDDCYNPQWPDVLKAVKAVNKITNRKIFQLKSTYWILISPEKGPMLDSIKQLKDDNLILEIHF